MKPGVSFESPIEHSGNYCLAIHRLFNSLCVLLVCVKLIWHQATCLYLYVLSMYILYIVYVTVIDFPNQIYI